jgi:hypothetical protein
VESSKPGTVFASGGTDTFPFSSRSNPEGVSVFITKKATSAKKAKMI